MSSISISDLTSCGKRDGAEPTSRLVARLGYVTDAMRVWLWETDAQHRFTYMSPSVERFAGRPPDWHYGRTREELGNVGVGDADWQELRRQLEQRKRFGPIETKRTEPETGHTIWMRSAGDPQFDADGVFVGYCGVGCEISEEIALREAKHKAEDELVEKLDMLSATIATMPCAVSVFDREQRLAFANPDYYALFDLPVGRFPAGTHMALIFSYLAGRGEFIGGDARDIVDRHMAIIESGEPHSFQRTRPNGRRLDIKGTPLAAGGFVRTYVDITDRIELQWRLDARNRDLSAALAALAASQDEASALRRQLMTAPSG